MAKFLDDNGLLYFWTTLKNTFVQDVNYVHTDNNFTNSLKTKLEGIEAGAEVNDIAVIEVNGTALTPSGKTVNITVPTVVSALTNDSGYQTSSQVQSAISSAIGQITGISFEIVQTLPATGTNGTIYLLSNGGSGTNVYDEYIYINSSWEKIGTTDVDLSGYWNSTNLTAITNSEIDTIVAN